MAEFREMLTDTLSKLCNETDKMARLTKKTVEIEAQKCRLSKIYEKIGEAVVSGSLAEGKGEEQIFKLVDEAKIEKLRLRELIIEKNNICKTSTCGNCGKQAKHGSYCSACGEYVK